MLVRSTHLPFAYGAAAVILLGACSLKKAERPSIPKETGDVDVLTDKDIPLPLVENDVVSLPVPTQRTNEVLAGAAKRQDILRSEPKVKAAHRPMAPGKAEAEYAANAMPSSIALKKRAVGGLIAEGDLMPNCCPPAPSIPLVNPEFNTESYSPITENGFQNVAQNPLSTFSIDVDNAAYSNVRRFLNEGQLPPPDAVRIEEMINYFPYPYAQPKGEHPFSIALDMGKTPWNSQTQLVLIGLKAREIANADLPPQNLTFLIDVSGSMDEPNKLPLLKKAFALLVHQMRPQDCVAMAVYAGAAGVVLEPTAGTHKEEILHALERLQAGGSTAGGAGLKLAYRLASQSFRKEGNNRVILATDGDFNVGESSDGAMVRLIEKERETGISLSVLGFGMGNYKDSKMEQLADKGNGNYAYIDNLQEARKVLVAQMGGTLQTLAKDVKLQVEWNPGLVKAYRLIGYENRLLRDEDFNDDTKDAGEIGAGHTVTALYEVLLAGSEMPLPKVDALKYGSNKAPESNSHFRKPQVYNSIDEEMLTVKFRYKPPQSSQSKLFSQVLKARENHSLEDASETLRFTAAMAGFGMLLRESAFRGNMSWEQIIRLAEGARSFDPEGYRAESIRLMRLAEAMQGPKAQARID